MGKLRNRVVPRVFLMPLSVCWFVFSDDKCGCINNMTNVLFVFLQFLNSVIIITTFVLYLNSVWWRLTKHILNSYLNIAFFSFQESDFRTLSSNLRQARLRTTIISKKSGLQTENFRSDYRGGKVAIDKAHKLFGALLVVSFYQSFHREVNDAGKKMNHLRQHTEQL